MLQFNHIEITSIVQANEIINKLKTSQVVAGGFDTETTGLHPVLDKPFLFICGWYGQDDKGETYLIDMEVNNVLAHWFITRWQKLAETFPIYLGHHIVYDLHMMTNAGMPVTYFDNLSDTQYWIRASSDAVQVEFGGESLALKDWAVRHINKTANANEKEVKALRTAQAKEYNAQLLKATGMKKKEFDEFFKDSLNDWTDLPLEVRDKYLEWHDSLPEYLQDVVEGTVDSDMIRYDKVDREVVKQYAFLDVDYTLTCYYLCKPVVEVRDNYELVRRENLQIPCLYEMERVGFLINVDYVKQAKSDMKEYIKQRRNDLCVSAGREVSVGQHAAIKQILAERFNTEVESTGQSELQLFVDKHRQDNPDACEFIQNILELRTLEKWYATYILRFLRNTKHTNRIYTAIHQVQAVSGRVSCDFQQFPKAGLFTMDGRELFDPRAMVITEAEYPAIVYLDYSAQELRVQALYTYLLGHPDTNMLRAYSPYECHRDNGHRYNPESQADRDAAYTGEWYTNESNELWTPTDLHGAMTTMIFGIDKSHPDFHDLRYVGKRANFAKNYGATYKCIRESFPEFDDETCHKIDEAYYKTFPGVKAYHKACDNWAQNSYMDNLFGVKYYGCTSHKLRNILIQGTSAYMTKDRIRAAYEFIKEHGYKSKFVMQIHDEVQFYIHKDDPMDIVFQLQKVMQGVDSQVPIVSDAEITFTDWKHKEEVCTLEDIERVRGEQLGQQ